MKRKFLIGLPLIILIVMSLLMAMHLYYRSPNFPYSPDSASYIEQARNLVNSGTLLNTPYGLAPSNIDQVENSVFPIGYAIILAALSTLGFDAKDVAIGIGYLSAMLLPWLLYACFRNALGSGYALVLAGLSLTSSGILLNSPQGLTDVFSLALAVSAISLTLNSKSNAGFFIGGILAGIAYAVRNVHLALLLTIALYYAYLWFIDKHKNVRTLYKNAASQFLGIGIIVFPILIRNISLFGTPNPYNMPPSSIGLIENLRTYIQALIKDVTACSECANHIAWSVPGLLGLILTVACLCWLISKYAWLNLDVTVKKTIVFSATYIVIGSAIVIAARTRYQWGELISIRHTLQYTPFLLAILLMPVLNVTTGHFTKTLRVFKVVLVIALAFFHTHYALYTEAFQDRNKDYAMLLNAYETGKNDLCAIENEERNAFIVSNWAYVFRIECASRARQIEPVHSTHNKNMQNLIADHEGYNNLIDAITDIQKESINRPIHIGFFPGRFGIEATDLPLPKNDQQTLLNAGWIIIRNDKSGLLLNIKNITFK